MNRDIIDSLMAGGLVSFLPFWILDDAMDQAAIAMGAAVLVYILILFFKEGTYENDQKEP